MAPDPVPPAPIPLAEIYRHMVVARRCDEEAVRLQRQGELVAYPPMAGQEAAQVASVVALRATDMVFPSYRELGAAVARGLDLVSYLVYYRGAWHSGLYDPRQHHFAPICSAVGSHLLHAVGWAMGRHKEGREDVALVFFGEGATSEGDASEAFNFAGVFRAPVIFFCQNNGWAISVPLQRQTAGEIWRRAEGFGFPGLRVDGNDPEAVYRATSQAAARARAGGGPTLIEALTHRLGAHSTADDHTRYRTSQELAQARRHDPILRLRRRLQAEGTEPTLFTRVEAEAERAAARLREGLRATPDPDPDDLFDFVYASSPPHLVRQRAARRAAAHPGGEPAGG